MAFRLGKGAWQMAVADEYRDRIRALDYAGVQHLWSQVQARDTPGWPPGMAFEYLLLRAFELEGAHVRWPYNVPPVGPPLEQIDGAVHLESLSCLIEAKDQTEPSNVEPIAKLWSQLRRRPAGVIGAVFSTSGFTDPAIQLNRLMAPQAVLVWQGREVTVALERQNMRAGLIAKYRFAIDYAIPDTTLEEMLDEVPYRHPGTD